MFHVYRFIVDKIPGTQKLRPVKNKDDRSDARKVKKYFYRYNRLIITPAYGEAGRYLSGIYAARSWRNEASGDSTGN
jgi:hypothetical protein